MDFTFGPMQKPYWIVPRLSSSPPTIDNRLCWTEPLFSASWHQVYLGLNQSHFLTHTIAMFWLFLWQNIQLSGLLCLLGNVDNIVVFCILVINGTTYKSFSRCFGKLEEWCRRSFHEEGLLRLCQDYQGTPEDQNDLNVTNQISFLTVTFLMAERTDSLCSSRRLKVMLFFSTLAFHILVVVLKRSWSWCSPWRRARCSWRSPRGTPACTPPSRRSWQGRGRETWAR